jgi:hypothetical protein
VDFKVLTWPKAQASWEAMGIWSEGREEKRGGEDFNCKMPGPFLTEGLVLQTVRRSWGSFSPFGKGGTLTSESKVCWRDC